MLWFVTMKSAENIFADGVACLRLNDYSGAEEIFVRLLKTLPGHVPTLLNLAVAQQALGKQQAAESTLKEIIQRLPENIDAKLMLSRLLLSQNRYQEVLQIYEQIAQSNPVIFEVHCNRAAVFNEIGKYESAVASARTALEINPSDINAHLNHGNALFNLNKYDEACTAYHRVLHADPNNVGGLTGLGNAFVELKRNDEALAIYQRLIENNAGHEGALVGRANLYFEAKQYEQALADYDRALSVRPDLAKAWYGRGNVFLRLKRYDEALIGFEKALSLKPTSAEAWLGRGNVFSDVKKYDEALGSYDKALALKPDLTWARGLRLHAKMHLCNWDNFDTECKQLVSSLMQGQLATPPFQLLAVQSSSADQLECAKLFVKETCPPSANSIWRGERYNHDRIRVAYFSTDFHEHAISYLSAGMFERHDRSRFEITAISLGPDIESNMRRRLKAGFDRFISVGERSDKEIAELIKDLEIDIAVDLNGFTQHARTSVFAMRPAPIQVNYLGYPSTMGADYIDYLIADQVLIQKPDQKHYTEKIAYLPNSYQVNNSERDIADSVFTREDMGLPPSGFIFCCFNNGYKITPAVFDRWMQVLKSVDGSVLWLLKENETSASNLRRQASARGVGSERLVFAGRLPLSQHLARHRLADLFLDTLPYNAHTTASDALWSGLPVLTQIGATFAGRVAASLLTAVGLPELITTTSENYVARAVELATNVKKLEAIKQQLENNRLTKPLFDTEQFTRHIEAAYSAMHERHRVGLAADYIHAGQ